MFPFFCDPTNTITTLLSLNNTESEKKKNKKGYISVSYLVVTMSYLSVQKHGGTCTNHTFASNHYSWLSIILTFHIIFMKEPEMYFCDMNIGIICFFCLSLFLLPFLYIMLIPFFKYLLIYQLLNFWRRVLIYVYIYTPFCICACIWHCF